MFITQALAESSRANRHLKRHRQLHPRRDREHLPCRIRNRGSNSLRNHNLCRNKVFPCPETTLPSRRMPRNGYGCRKGLALLAAGAIIITIINPNVLNLEDLNLSRVPLIMNKMATSL
jgi:hypothetical protein